MNTKSPAPGGEAIKPGDMVMLVWACCAKGRRFLGWTGIVEDMYHVAQGVSRCFCGHGTTGMHAWVDIDGRGIVPVSWLKKIEPPSTPESAERTEEITA